MATVCCYQIQITIHLPQCQALSPARCTIRRWHAYTGLTTQQHSRWAACLPQIHVWLYAVAVECFVQGIQRILQRQILRLHLQRLLRQRVGGCKQRDGVEGEVRWSVAHLCMLPLPLPNNCTNKWAHAAQLAHL